MLKDINDKTLFKEVEFLPKPKFKITEKDVGRKVMVQWDKNKISVSLITDFFLEWCGKRDLVYIGKFCFSKEGIGLDGRKITGWADE